jgi:hypothetical protein
MYNAFAKTAGGSWHDFDICSAPDFIAFFGGLPNYFAPCPS